MNLTVTFHLEAGAFVRSRFRNVFERYKFWVTSGDDSVDFDFNETKGFCESTFHIRIEGEVERVEIVCDNLLMDVGNPEGLRREVREKIQKEKSKSYA